MVTTGSPGQCFWYNTKGDEDKSSIFARGSERRPHASKEEESFPAIWFAPESPLCTESLARLGRSLLCNNLSSTSFFVAAWLNASRSLRAPALSRRPVHTGGEAPPAAVPNASQGGLGGYWARESRRANAGEGGGGSKREMSSSGGESASGIPGTTGLWSLVSMLMDDDWRPRTRFLRFVRRARYWA